MDFAFIVFQIVFHYVSLEIHLTITAKLFFLSNVKLLQLLYFTSNTVHGHPKEPCETSGPTGADLKL